jgi:hypothetical protein
VVLVRDSACRIWLSASAPVERRMRPSPAGLRLLRPWEAPASRFDDHHVELARMLRDHIDALGIQIDRLTSRIQELIGAIPAAQPPGDGAPAPNWS